VEGRLGKARYPGSPRFDLTGDFRQIPWQFRFFFLKFPVRSKNPL